MLVWESARAQDQWSNVVNLPPGTEVRMTTVPPVKRWKGTLVRADAASISFKQANGQESRIALAEVREVRRVRRSVKYAPLVGAVAGAMVTTILTSRQGSDLTAAGVVLWAGIGAGIGAAGGAGVRAAASNVVVFRR